MITTLVTSLNTVLTGATVTLFPFPVGADGFTGTFTISFTLSTRVTVTRPEQLMVPAHVTITDAFEPSTVALALARVMGIGARVVVVTGGTVDVVLVARLFESEARLMLPASETLCAGYPESETVAVNEYEPPALGVPEISPLEESVTPGGSDPEVNDQLSEPLPPEAERLAL